MVTVKEIAQMCNVSPSTVSNILNGKTNVGEETRNRVLQVVKETGYKPNFFASSMRKQKSRMIGVIVEDLDQFTTPPIVVAIMAYCEKMGYRNILMNLRMYDRWQDTWYSDEKKLTSVLHPFLREAEAMRMDGIIYVAGHGRILKCFPKDYNVPTVMAYAISEKNRFPSILMDDETGGYDMGKYLLSMGHKNIGIITGVDTNMHSQKRLAGFQKALFEAGIPYNPQCTFHGTWQRESGYRKAADVLACGVTAIWCMNDQMAAGVYDYLYEHNIQPGKDISVAGFDGMENAEYMYPRLTTNALPLSEIGLQSAETIIHMIETEGWKPDNMKRWLPCSVIIGNSVVDLNQ